VTDPTINESHPLYWQRKFDAKVQECERLKTLVALCRNSVERDGRPHIVARIDACIKEPQP